ncbi:RES family NAD+ phosphorylase [Sphingopyxis sp. JAI128]|uniref:RES family NAD+ phosphorylase n=1 Tax=Sphingopyxis sp. JAI128 TaxID=2723066 RepID=UPI00161033AB|nr:RES family NAD+ phosphorylase [Sphingopyxis sp. JAI128]MBB6428054.1 hypothetical protein [Sphingopyxis sp. JAI128]
MELDDPAIPEFASWRSYADFADRVRHGNRYIWSDAIQAFLDTVIATITQRDQVLQAGRHFFRAQRGVVYEDHHDADGNWTGESIYGYLPDRMKPLPRRAKEGRANPAGIPVLYLGSTVETVVSEVRPWIGAEISVARGRLIRDLRTLDLSLGHGQSSFAGPVFAHIMGGTPLSAAEKKTAVWTDIDNAFSKPVTLSDDAADYVPTQILAELFRARGYDAIAYKSYFGEAEGYNIAVFDPSSVEIITCAPYRVETIKVQAVSIGEDWITPEPGASADDGEDDEPDLAGADEA